MILCNNISFSWFKILNYQKMKKQIKSIISTNLLKIYPKNLLMNLLMNKYFFFKISSMKTKLLG